MVGIKGQLMLISGIVAGLILISTASTISSIQSERFNPKSISKDISVIKMEAESLNLENPEDRRKFREFVDSFPGYASDIKYWSSQKCFNVTLRRRSDLYKIDCVGKKALAPKELLFSLISLEDFNNKGSYNGTSASRADLSEELGIGYRNGTSGDGLVGFWRMDSTSAVTDYSGEDNDGTNFGASRVKQGVFSTKAMKFDGSNDYVDIDPFNSNEDQKTISYWAYFPDEEQDEFSRLIQIGGTRSTRPTDGVSHENNAGGAGPDKLKIVHWESGSFQDMTTVDVNTDSWNHVTHVMDGNDIKVYVNGAMVDDYTGSSGSDPTQPVTFGAGDNNYWEGRLDEVRIYNRALSENEVKGLYFHGFTGSYLGDYESDSVNVDSERKVSQLEVKSNISSSTSTDVILRHSGGVTETINLDTGLRHKNYSVTTLPKGGQVKVDIQANSNDVELSPVIEELRLWTSE